MKANLSIKINFGGTVNVEKSVNTINKSGDEFEKSNNYESNKVIDFTGFACNIEVKEELEDITTKEYILAIGEAVKTAFCGVFNKVKSTPKEIKED